MFNKVVLIGNLTKDVELRYTPNGTAVAKFGIATNRNFKDSVTGKNKQEVMFIDVAVFGRSAEVANQYLAKGKRVLVEGRLVFNQWVDSSGQKRSKHSIVAERIQFIDSKASADESANTPVPKQEMSQSQLNQDIPSIDVDDEEIPF